MAAETEPWSVLRDWQLTREARTYINGLFKRRKRVQFGLLEHPGFVSPLLRKAPVHTCKIFFYGKAGIGKTSTVMKLAGLPVPLTHQETLGIQTTNIYWPVKLATAVDPMQTSDGDHSTATVASPVELLQMELWDTGERMVRKFEHVLPSCLTSTNVIAFFFSLVDRASWNELPDVIGQASATGRIDSHLKVVIATRADAPQPQVSQEELEHFKLMHGIRIIPINNVNSCSWASDGTLDGLKELNDICLPLNMLAELVLEHERSQSLLQLPIKKAKQDIEISDV